jgi:hypothetical protein
MYSGREWVAAAFGSNPDIGILHELLFNMIGFVIAPSLGKIQNVFSHLMFHRRNCGLNPSIIPEFVGVLV